MWMISVAFMTTLEMEKAYYKISRAGRLKYSAAKPCARLIAKKLYFCHGVAAPCRTTCTVCGLLPCGKNKFFRYIISRIVVNKRFRRPESHHPES
ncbi:hypothetical protein, partial [Neisseria dentiae]|uniref:hypothetical protein n=1 Tax=Neisseria dentiae TaxID=194197 RepID=UPI00211B8EDD